MTFATTADPKIRLPKKRVEHLAYFNTPPAMPTRKRPPRLKLPTIPRWAQEISGPVVYVIKCGDFVKIGIASHFLSRLRGLVSANPHKLKIVQLFQGGPHHEASLHAKFAADRHNGEWFHYRGAVKYWCQIGCPYPK